MGYIYITKSASSRKCAENLFPNILAWGQVCLMRPVCIPAWGPQLPGHRYSILGSVKNTPISFQCFPAVRIMGRPTKKNDLLYISKLEWLILVF